MKIWYIENTNRDESNDILYDIIYLCILVKKYGQRKLGQNCIFSNESSIAEQSIILLLRTTYQRKINSNTRVIYKLKHKIYCY